MSRTVMISRAARAAIVSSHTRRSAASSLLAIVLLCSLLPANAAVGPFLVKDINAVAGGGITPDPEEVVAVGATLFYAGRDGTTGKELWKSDGTAAGTMRVADINPGPVGSYPYELTNVNGTLFFTADDGTTGAELWKSDGTAAGTVRVADIPGPMWVSPDELTNVNGTLFFEVDDGTTGRELWKSDGTAAGTVRVADINPGPAGSFPDELTNVNGTVFFEANDGTTGAELWKSDGTAAGTVRVADINPTGHSTPREFTNVNGTLFFTAHDGTVGGELWKSDGTAAGTVRVAVINSTGDSSLDELTNVNGTLFFKADDGTTGDELWKSDGTAAGTVRVADIDLGPAGSSPDELTNVNGTLFFVADDGTTGDELWKSDGTTAGTELVKDIFPGGEAYFPSPWTLTNVNGTLFFFDADATTGYELWKSDGMAVGTTLVKDAFPGTSGSSPSELTHVNGILFFSANDPTTGIELWKSDGAEGRTVQVADINPAADSYPSSLTNVNGTLFFTADDGTTGDELWKSDGTAAGTVRVADINPGPVGSSPDGLINVDGTLFFAADDGTTGGELWKSDGTAAGTVRVADINPASSFGFRPSLRAVVDGTLFLVAADGTTGPELWKSDGTAAGTVQLSDLNPDSGGTLNLPLYLTNVNGTLFFSVDDGSGSASLWKSDGTAAGTVLVANISSHELTNVNGTLFFNGADAATGRELWKSDGTAAGTVLVADINPTGNSSPSNLTNVDGTLFFSASDRPAWGSELWKSDGTAAGTVQVADINPGYPPSIAPATWFGDDAEFTNMNGVLFFKGSDGVTAWDADTCDTSPTYCAELWRSDGTAAGTFLVDDTYPGSLGSHTQHLTHVNGRLFFTANDDVHGVTGELFAFLPICPDTDSDGTCDLLDPCSNDPLDACDENKSGSGIIGSDGGTIETPDGSVKIDIPPHTFSDPTPVSITGGEDSEDPYFSLGAGKENLAILTDIEPGGQLAQNVTITFTWKDEEIPPTQAPCKKLVGANAKGSGRDDILNLEENDLSVRHKTAADQHVGWITQHCKNPGCVPGTACVSATCDLCANQWVVQVDHFSEFAVVAEHGEAKCMKTIAKEGAKYAQARAKILTKCELEKLQGKHSDPCPHASAAPGSPARKAAEKIAKAGSKLAAKIAKTCGGDDKLCNGDADTEFAPRHAAWPATCPGFQFTSEPACNVPLDDCGDLTDCLACIQSEAIAEPLEMSFGEFAPGASEDALKCQRAIGKETWKFQKIKGKTLQKCWEQRLKGKHGDTCPNPAAEPGTPARKAADKIAKARSKLRAKMCKACGGPDKECSEGGDDLPISDISPGLEGAGCATLGTSSGSSCHAEEITDLEGLLDCVTCVSEFSVDCMAAAQVPEFVSYPAACVGWTTEDLTPCDPPAGDIWTFSVDAPGSITVTADTVDVGTAADLCFEVYCSGTFLGDDEVPCTYSPPMHGCPKTTFAITEPVGCGIFVTVCSDQCRDPGLAKYRLSIDRDGELVVPVLAADDL